MTGLTQQEKDNQLFKAVQKGDIEAIVTAHTAGAKLEALEQQTNDNRHKSLRTPLILAVEKGDWTVCQKLIELGAKIDGHGQFKRTPLMSAAAYNHAEICSELIRLGADKNARDSSNNTPLLIATSFGSTLAASILIAAGANVEASDLDGNTPLIISSINGRHDIIRKLIEHGADIEKTDKKGNTALIVSSTNYRNDATRILLEYGANIEAKNHEGETALLFAAKKDNGLAARELLHAGAEIKAHDRISFWIGEMKRYVKELFPAGTIPSRKRCFADDKISRNILNACVTGQFTTFIAAPLITSTNPEDRKLFQDIWDKLPPYWQRTYAATHVAFVKAGGVNPILGHHTGAHRSGNTATSNLGLA